MYVENVRLNRQVFPATRSTCVKYKKRRVFTWSTLNALMVTRPITTGNARASINSQNTVSTLESIINCLGITNCLVNLFIEKIIHVDAFFVELPWNERNVAVVLRNIGEFRVPRKFHSRSVQDLRQNGARSSGFWRWFTATRIPSSDLIHWIDSSENRSHRKHPRIPAFLYYSTSFVTSILPRG